MPIRKKIKNSKSQAHEAFMKSSKQLTLQKHSYFWRHQTPAWPAKDQAQILQGNLLFFFFVWMVLIPQSFSSLRFIPKGKNWIPRDKKNVKYILKERLYESEEHLLNDVRGVRVHPWIHGASAPIQVCGVILQPSLI
jgi:hypothetical protein